MNEKRLFRSEVVDGQRNRNFGSVSINTPIKYTLLTLFFSILFILVFFFILLGEFSEKFIVKGYLESTKGVARVYPEKNGVVAKCFIHQGDEVKPGDKLFLMTTSYENFGQRPHHGVLEKLEKKKQSIHDEIRDKEQHLEALKPLLVKKYISLSSYHEQHEKLVVLQHQLSSVEVELMNLKHEKSYVVRSPIHGIISSVLYHEGQSINGMKPLMKILPFNADLMAELFVPVRQSGFLKPKNQVMIHYDAFPYARFGASKAIIQEISRSVSIDAEEEKPIHIGQPYYKVSALLNEQYVKVYGVDKKIQHGMTLSAVIIGQKRKVWQWIMDPLYSFYGGVVL